MNIPRLIRILKFDWPFVLAIVLSVLAIFKLSDFNEELLGNPDRVFLYSDGNGGYSRAFVSRDPRYTDEKVVRFLRRMVSSCYTVDYKTAQHLMNGERDNDYANCIDKHFAPIAATSLFNVYPTDPMIEAILMSEGKANVVVPYDPIVTLKNKPGKPLVWVVEVPIMVTVQSVSGDQTTSFIAHYTVLPEPRADNASSLLIDRVVFR